MSKKNINKITIMKKLTVYLCTLFALVLPNRALGAEPSDTLFLKLSDGGIRAFPTAMIQSRSQNGPNPTITTIYGDTYEYSNVEVSGENPIKEWADITEFKLNNKYNDQLHTDILAEISENTLTATIGAIGKWLTPSFILSTEDANLYLNHEKLVTRESRHSYANTQTLTVAKDNHLVYGQRTVKSIAGETRAYTSSMAASML